MSSLPEDEMQKILLTLAQKGEGLRRSLNYCSNAGDKRFRTAIRSFIDRRTHNDDAGNASLGREKYTDDNIFVTNGVSHGLQLMCGLAKPGDEVWLERPTYFLAADLFSGNHLVVKPLPMKCDSSGVDIDRLTAMVEREGVSPPKFIYIIPSYQNPTGSVLSVEERRKLAGFASKHGVIVLADEVYHLLDWEKDSRVDESMTATRRPASLAWFNPAIDGDNDSGCCVSVSSFTKIWSPGVRVGWIEAPTFIIRKLERNGYIGECCFAQERHHRCNELHRTNYFLVRGTIRFAGRMRSIHGQGADGSNRDQVAGQLSRQN